MKASHILSLWAISFTLMVLFAESLPLLSILFFIPFAKTSVYIEKHSKEISREINYKHQDRRFK